jgi:hypothetical protein
LRRVTMCPNCGALHYEQSSDDGDVMDLRCLSCGYTWHVERYRDEGEDKWRDPRDRDGRY